MELKSAIGLIKLDRKYYKNGQLDFEMASNEKELNFNIINNNKVIDSLIIEDSKKISKCMLYQQFNIPVTAHYLEDKKVFALEDNSNINKLNENLFDAKHYQQQIKLIVDSNEFSEEYIKDITVEPIVNFADKLIDYQKENNKLNDFLVKSDLIGNEDKEKLNCGLEVSSVNTLISLFQKTKNTIK